MLSDHRNRIVMSTLSEPPTSRQNKSTTLCFALVKSIGLITHREYAGIYGLDKGYET